MCIRDRDTTIKSINELIKDDFSIRLLVDSAEDDTLSFCVLPNEQWEMLEKEFGKNNLNRYFIKVTPVSYTHLDVYKRQVLIYGLNFY